MNKLLCLCMLVVMPLCAKWHYVTHKTDLDTVYLLWDELRGEVVMTTLGEYDEYCYLHYDDPYGMSSVTHYQKVPKGPKK